jgi:hypothetical protein
LPDQIPLISVGDEPWGGDDLIKARRLVLEAQQSLTTNDTKSGCTIL